MNFISEYLEVRTSDLMRFNFSEENLKNYCEAIPIENTVEKTKTTGK